jgi:hypothetical protein
MKIEDEMLLLPKLKHVGIALAQFAYSLHPGTFKKRTEWIYSQNFVGFAIQYKRSEKIVLSLKHCPSHIADEQLLPLYVGRWPSYMRCGITTPRQLACAARYIEICYNIWYQNVCGKRLSAG